MKKDYCKMSNRQKVGFKGNKPVLDNPAACVCCPYKDCEYRSRLAKILDWDNKGEEGWEEIEIRRAQLSRTPSTKKNVSGEKMSRIEGGKVKT